MDPGKAFCPNKECPARGRVGKGNIKVHSRKERRYRCTVCGKTFRERKGTMFYLEEAPHGIDQSGRNPVGLWLSGARPLWSPLG